MKDTTEHSKGRQPADRAADSHLKVARKNAAVHKAQKLKRVKEMLASRRNQPQDKDKASDKGSSSSSSSVGGAIAQARDSKPGKDGRLSALQEKMQQKLKGARFRWINEVMYTETGDKTFGMVQADPSIFAEYHKGFAAQVQKWPVNPVDVFISQLQGRKRAVVADLGCGEAKLAAAVGSQHTVHSFDLVAHNERITPCNIADVPLPDNSVDVAIFCLALMGTDFLKFVREANRILREGGELKIAEVVSRIASTEAFVAALEEQGFRLDRKTTLSKMFIMLDLTKIRRCPSTFQMASGLLKPCIYKRR